jgi:histidinol dehydrogenase
MKKSSIISFSKRAIRELGQKCADIAEIEGLEAHRQSVLSRLA